MRVLTIAGVFEDFPFLLNAVTLLLALANVLGLQILSLSRAGWH